MAQYGSGGYGGGQADGYGQGGYGGGGNALLTYVCMHECFECFEHKIECTGRLGMGILKKRTKNKS